MVMNQRRVTTIDEDALRRERRGGRLARSCDAVPAGRAPAEWQPDVGMQRFVGGRDETGLGRSVAKDLT